MSIELMERALEFITGVYIGEHEGSRADREKLEADLTTAIQQAEVQQPATAIACGIPGMAKTTCPYCEQGFAFEHEQLATGEPVKAERDQLRCAQADAVMPLIGPLLDAWENADREVISQEPELSRQLKAINNAMEDAQPATTEPTQADSSEHLRVIASLGAALRRLSFAAQTTGGTDGPDAELQSAIGQAEQALSLGGIGQAMFATTEPVWCVATGERVNGEETYTHHDDYVPLADCFPIYTRPAPSVPDAVARDAERYRWLRENGTLGFSGAPSWRASVSFDAVDAYAQTLDSNIDAAQAQKGQG